jgi:hypothetical protein
MAIPSYGTITDQDVERLEKHAEREIKEMTPEKAKTLLIEIGALTPDGRPRWPANEQVHPNRKK